MKRMRLVEAVVEDNEKLSTSRLRTSENS
ncbi:hypothetical protein QQF64_036447, partial [Cirrhinus molitorella]